MSDTNITLYLDINGLPVQKDGDAGDSCQRAGMITFGRFLNRDANLYQYNFFMKKLQIEPGVLVRNPSEGWWNDPLNLSRDQTRPIVIAAGAYKDTTFLKANLWNLIKNFGFYPNIYPNYVKPGDPGYKWKIPDFASPEHYGEYIRALYAAGNKYMLALYPLLLLGDCFKLLGTLIDVFYVDRDLSRSDDVNTIISHLQAFNWLPTPISWLARKVYSKFRPIIPNNQGISSGPESALWAYFSGPNDITPIYYLYKPLMGKYFNEKE